MAGTDHDGKRSPAQARVDLAAVARVQHKHDEHAIFDRVDDPVVPYPDAPGVFARQLLCPGVRGVVARASSLGAMRSWTALSSFAKASAADGFKRTSWAINFGA